MLPTKVSKSITSMSHFSISGGENSVVYIKKKKIRDVSSLFVLALGIYI